MNNRLLYYALFSVSLWPARGEPLPTIEEKTKSMEPYDGYFDFYWEESSGKIWLEIDRWNEEFLYANSLPAGIGSNDIGLDRGQMGNGRVVAFHRVGPKVLMMQPNYGFRAESDSAAEKRAVEEAFAQSALGGFEVAAETEGSVLVDLTDFLLQDAHGVARRLERAKQGNYSIDLKRSAIYLARTRNFPENSEFEATLTFKGDPKGEYIRKVAPSPDSVTVRLHHSFVKLPDDGYKKRLFDVRSGFGKIEFHDYATPIESPLLKQFIRRHRLEKKDPEASISEAVEPIVYYLDPGAPEPIRSALLEGAQWWNEAFEAIGYKDAFQVRMLPEDADPMDARYNVINWVHRATRGWSYGYSLVDPRTGEIIKGQVTLGSLRVRQDYLIAQGLLSPFGSENPDTSALTELALARLRQLSAHEVGHTLGISHNFASSPQNRASVMDYPHPLTGLGEDGSIDLSQAYDTGIGEWDKATIAFGYLEIPDGANEKVFLSSVLEDTIAAGLAFISDQDARPAGGAHPDAHLWDNGADAADELLRILDIRKRALRRFSETSIPIGTPYSSLEDVLVPLYLSHRYQVDAASKLLGGLQYNYAVRGDGQLITQMVSPSRQRNALSALLESLTSETLSLSEEILALIPPPAFGNSRGRENFETRTGITFDPLAAAETSAAFTASFLFHPERASRLIEYHARNSKNPSLGELIDRTVGATWKKAGAAGLALEVERVVDNVVLKHLIQLAADSRSTAQVRALAELKLEDLRTWLAKESGREKDESQKAHYKYGVAEIERYFEDPEEFEAMDSLSPPAGSPIGMACACGAEWHR